MITPTYLLLAVSFLSQAFVLAVPAPVNEGSTGVLKFYARAEPTPVNPRPIPKRRGGITQEEIDKLKLPSQQRISKRPKPKRRGAITQAEIDKLKLPRDLSDELYARIVPVPVRPRPPPRRRGAITQEEINKLKLPQRSTSKRQKPKRRGGVVLPGEIERLHLSE